MRRLLRLAIWLYPPRWRQRYAREFEALLDEIDPGGRELFDVLKGAFTVQIRMIGAIPVLLALVGGTVGGYLASQTPIRYTSQALILFRGADLELPESLQNLKTQLQIALGGSQEERAAVALTLEEGRGGRQPVSFLRLSYKNRDALQARRVATKLVTALASSSQPSWELRIADPPNLPNQPNSRHYFTSIGAGTIIGLAIGSLLAMVWHLLRRPVDAFYN